MASIHPTAIVADGAVIGNDVSIGPYCVVGPEVVLADGVSISSHVVLEGHTEIGAGTRIYPFASIGTPPQDLSYKGEPNPDRHRQQRHHPRARDRQSGHGEGPIC